MPKNDNHYALFSLYPFFIAGVLLSALWLRRKAARVKRDREDRIADYLARQEQLNKAARELLDFLVDIVNAAALSGDSEYLMVKRINLVLNSRRGEGKTFRDDFTRLADFCCGGFISSLKENHPDLSASERSVCGMLVLGMEPATISRICGFEHEQTFYNKRKEIRKKLGLEHSTPLEAFLQERIEQMNRERSEQVESMLQNK